MTVKLIFGIFYREGKISHNMTLRAQSLYTHTPKNHSQNLYTQSVCTFWDDLNFGESPTPDELYEQKNLGVSFRKNYSKVFKI